MVVLPQDVVPPVELVSRSPLETRRARQRRRLKLREWIGEHAVQASPHEDPRVGRTPPDSASPVGIPIRPSAREQVETFDESRSSTPDLVDASNHRAAVAQLLADDSIDVAFQPVIALDSGAIVGLEAWPRLPAHRGRTTEGWFLLAGSAGLGSELEAAVLRRAFTVLENLPEGVYLSVNVSPGALLSDAVRRVLESVPLDSVVLEITEQARAADYSALADVLQPWRARGARIAVDETESGFASLSNVLRLEPEIIKLNASLTHHIDSDSILRALAYTLKAFAGAVGAETVAEGVENERELYALRFLGVPYGHGVYLHKALGMDPSTWPDDFAAAVDRLAGIQTQAEEDVQSQ